MSERSDTDIVLVKLKRATTMHRMTLWTSSRKVARIFKEIQVALEQERADRLAAEANVRLLEEVCFHEAEMLEAAIDTGMLTAEFVSVTARRLQNAAPMFPAPAPKEEGEG